LGKIYFILTIDTEEDQWGISKEKSTTQNIKFLTDLQRVLNDNNIKPTYLVDYPVVADHLAVEILSKIIQDGSCEIGAHLHPWNTPPFVEEMNNRNTMMVNLPSELQLKKISYLTKYIEENLGTRPICFRAGRFGLGKETVKALIDCGYLVDSSVTPFTSWECYEGPSFLNAPFSPYYIDNENIVTKTIREQQILEVPITIGYNRWPFERWQVLDVILEKSPGWLHIRGLIGRSNILRKIWLSPEMETAKNMLKLSKILCNHGIKVLNMTFHSNSLIPGLGPFIRNDNDLSRFYNEIAAYFRGLNRLGEVKPIFLSNVMELMCEGKI
jgi:hypothetical protein